MSKENELGALWVKDGKNGKFFSGNVEIDGKKTDIVVFKNTYKEEGSRQPDLKILKSTPREGHPEKKAQEILGADDFESDIPF